LAKKRKRRTRAEMQAAKDAQKTNGKVKEKLENGELSDKQLLIAGLPKEVKKEYVYVDKEVPVIKEVRIINENQGTEKSVSEIVREEVGKVKSWEYKMIPMNQFNIKELHKLGKAGWQYVFDLDPQVTSSVKVTTFVFQRAE
jgi:hypothetical protein